MTGNINAKTIAWVGIPLLAAGSLAIVNTVSQGVLFEVKKAMAAMEEAKASNKAAEAQTLDAINKLKGTLETAAAMTAVGKLQADSVVDAAQKTAAGVIAAAKQQADGLVTATSINSHPENDAYDSITGPLFAEPTKKLNELNTQIIRMKKESETGIDSKTRRVLSEEERADRIARKLALEEELSTVQESASKTMADGLGILMGGMSQGIGDLNKLYTTRGTSAPAPRRSLLEK